MLRVVKLDFVAVGTFNIYVLQPEWFTHVKLFEVGQEVTVQTDLTRPGYRYTSADSPIQWTITPEKVIAATESRDVDCGKAIRKVVETLEWTPLLAVGGNVNIKGDITDPESMLFRPFVPNDLSGLEWKNSASVVTLKSGDRLFRLTTIFENDSFQIVANIHTDLSGIQDRTERLTAALAASDSFLADCQTAVSLIERLFSVKIENNFGRE